MNILHVLSQREVTGAETYAVTLAEDQLRQGHRVWIVSDTLRTPTQVIYLSQPIDNRRYGQRLKNIFFLRKIILEEAIEVVHAHSRAASWVSYFALLGTKVPLISTVHGRQHLHTSTSLFDMYGDKVIAVCEDLKTHLVSEVKMQESKITVIPNGIDFSALSSVISPSTLSAPKPILSLVGRTSGPKGERTGQIIKKALPALLEEFPLLEVNIIGGPTENLGQSVLSKISELNQTFANRVHCLGFVTNLPVYLAKSSVIVASGRVAMDALYLERPLLAFGESQYHGLVNSQNLLTVFASNFGDILPNLPVPEPDYKQIEKDVTHVLRADVVFESVKEAVMQRFNVEKVATAVMDEYQSARLKKQFPRHIPVLMYHKIPNAPLKSKHRIFVTKATFERHLQFLQSRGFTPITFKDYDAYKRGQRPLTDFPAKPIFLTFDDAYLDNYTNAFPLLKKYSFKGTIFSLGEESHRDNFWDVRMGEKSEPLMNTAQKLEMQAYGIEFGAHTLNHVLLTEVSEAEAIREIRQSKENLEAQLGVSVISFAYPYGKVNEPVKEWVRAAGYRYAVVIDGGGLHLEDDPLEIFRAYVFPEDAEPQLRKKTTSWYRRYFRWKRGK